MISQANQRIISDLKEDRGRKGVKLCGEIGRAHV